MTSANAFLPSLLLFTIPLSSSKVISRSVVLILPLFPFFCELFPPFLLSCLAVVSYIYNFYFFISLLPFGYRHAQKSTQNNAFHESFHVLNCLSKGSFSRFLWREVSCLRLGHAWYEDQPRWHHLKVYEKCRIAGLLSSVL